MIPAMGRTPAWPWGGRRGRGAPEPASPTAEHRRAFEEGLREQGRALLDALDPDEREQFESAVVAALRSEQRQFALAGAGGSKVRLRLSGAIRAARELLSVPGAILFLLSSPRFDPSYGLTPARRLALGVRMYRNTRRVTTGTSYRAHLAMAAKLFEIPPSVEGVVVECGCWVGGTSVNLSLACEIVGRDLVLYDTFEGLPPPLPNDKYAKPEYEGFFLGALDEVRSNIAANGALDLCSFRKGLFEDTLPDHTEPVVLAFVDVDYSSSLHDCVVNLWPHLTAKGYLFVDEYTRIDYCALFFSEQWWRRHLDTTPPGMIGVGSGIGVGQYYLGPSGESPPLQAPTSVAYTRKDFDGLWDFDRAGGA